MRGAEARRPIGLANLIIFRVSRLAVLPSSDRGSRKQWTPPKPKGGRDMVSRSIAISLALLALAGCATAPAGPTVMAMPGPDKSFEQFQGDDAVCRQWAVQQAGGHPETAAAQNAAAGAGIGTPVGAGAAAPPRGPGGQSAG